MSQEKRLARVGSGGSIIVLNRVIRKAFLRGRVNLQQCQIYTVIRFPEMAFCYPDRVEKLDCSIHPGLGSYQMSWQKDNTSNDLQ